MQDEATTDDSHSVFSGTTGGAGANNTALNQLLVAIQARDNDGEPQDILDMHCKRIWERSGQHTPKSPTRAKSPDHINLQQPHGIVSYLNYELNILAIPGIARACYV